MASLFEVIVITTRFKETTSAYYPTVLPPHPMPVRESIFYFHPMAIKSVVRRQVQAMLFPVTPVKASKLTELPMLPTQRQSQAPSFRATTSVRIVTVREFWAMVETVSIYSTAQIVLPLVARLLVQVMSFLETQMMESELMMALTT